MSTVRTPGEKLSKALSVSKRLLFIHFEGTLYALSRDEVEECLDVALADNDATGSELDISPDDVWKRFAQ